MNAQNISTAIEFLKREKAIAEEIIEDAPSHTPEEIFYQEGRADAYEEAILMISGNSHLVRRFTDEARSQTSHNRN